METFDLARLLTLAGLMIGTFGYFMVIRRRRARRDEDEARRRTESHQRAAARFRRLQRRDNA